MRILFLTPRDSRKNLGGVERHVRLLTEELVKRGYMVREFALENKFNGSLVHKFKYKLLTWKSFWKNRRFVREADIVHIHDIFWWYLPFRFLFLRKPVFTTFHGWEGRWPPSRSAVIQKKLAAWLSDGTIGVGNFYRKWYGVRPDRVVWGVLNNKFIASLDPSTRAKALAQDDGRASGRTLLAFFGRLEEVNGIEVVIGAIKLMRALKVRPWLRPRSDLSIVFVGDGSYRKEAEKVGKVTGMVAEPWKYLMGAEAVIASSYLAILEAAAMGKRIIAVVNNPLKLDYLEGYPLRKYFKICRSADELAREIIKRIHPGIRQGESLARNWALGQTAERLADEYEKLWRIRGEG